ncbi:MAG: AMP-binding protein [Alphaproteobacteria bacterium]|nr:AMP-binding protein [Alphaproteobacteria bacterium]
MQDFGATAANYTPLSPLSFMRRAATVHPSHPAVMHGDFQYDWATAYARARQLASALQTLGIGKNSTVSIMAPNIPALFDAHYGVPMAGAVLNPLNTRLDADTIAHTLEHSEAKVLITDTEFSLIVEAALSQLDHPPFVVDIDDPLGPGGKRLGDIEYEAFLQTGDPDFAWSLPDDEWDAISLCYTSGTTGNPKGVVYHHRGAYLLALGNVMAWSLPLQPTYLWTLPMFHCDGWCFPWTLAAVGGTSVCLRRVEARAIFDAIADKHVTHFCGAPIVLNLLAHATESERRPLPHRVSVMTAAASPPASVLRAMEEEGFDVTHVYGLTEVYGPAVVCAWHEEWDDKPIEERASIKSRQGVAYPVLEDLIVADANTGKPVPNDGETLGEVFMRGNVVMKGYLKNEQATAEAFEGGWFHTGDLGVWHEDNYVELKDRSKDIIISGGENISTIEVEGVLYGHPAVFEAAVVAKHDDHWGEVPCAFVTLHQGTAATEAEIIAFCRDNMAHYKAPKHVVFGELPKTSTGKVQKFELRERTRAV